MLFFSRKGDRTLISDISAPRAIKIPKKLKVEELTVIFNDLFSDSFNTCLEGGADEPLYLPASSICKHNRLIFFQDYISRALYDISHSCIVGDKCRNLLDYVSLYYPDGRCVAEKTILEKVE